MTYLPAVRWNCDYCRGTILQEGPLARSMPPIPPVGWFLVDVVWYIPAHSVQTSSGPVKVGDARETVRKTACPECGDAVLDLVLNPDEFPRSTEPKPPDTVT